MEEVKCVCRVCGGRSQIRNQLKRKAYEDAGLQPPTAATGKGPMKVINAGSEPHSKKLKTSGNRQQQACQVSSFG